MFLASCDTMVIMGDTTECGSVIFAKNSDRQVNEPMSIRYVPSIHHPSNSKLMATYLEIDQVENTNACVLFSPTNIFGAEMGFNSHGLVMGNEALFTKIPSKEIGLTGMDLVRLVLERCTTSEEGKETLITLLNKYGQGGNCGFSTPFYYHNSFLIVDSREAWLIETVGKDYAAKRIRSGIQTISNEISFGHRDTFDECSDNLIKQAINNGLSFHPGEFYSGFIKTKFACGSQRRQTSQQQLTSCSKPITINDVFNNLRHHQRQDESPGHGLMKMDLCMHAAMGPIRFTQTTGSLVSVLPAANQNQLPTYFATCSSLPCLSVYKPMWLTSSSVVPSILNSTSCSLFNTSLTYSSNSIWWKSEVINRNLMKFYQKLIGRIQIERDQLEKDFIHQVQQLSSKDVNDKRREEFSVRCFDQSDQLAIQWFNRSQDLSTNHRSEYSILNELTWESWRKSALIPSHYLDYSKVHLAKRSILLIGSSMMATYSTWIIYSRQNQFVASLSVTFSFVTMIYQLFHWRQSHRDNERIHFDRITFPIHD